MTTILNISIVLRLRIHVFYGSSLCTCVSGRPRNVCQRARQRPLWTFAIYGIELSYWPPISMYVCRVTVQFLSLLLTKVAVLISVLFSVISYWLSNFYPNADAFFTWVMWIFLDLVAAESLVVFASSMFPNFVIALAIVAFANGLWMCVGGFLVPLGLLNPFWKYVFHYIDYQVSSGYALVKLVLRPVNRRMCSRECW